MLRKREQELAERGETKKAGAARLCFFVDKSSHGCAKFVQGIFPSNRERIRKTHGQREGREHGVRMGGRRG
ncbi:hypothetical protein B4113_1495 [Geobacillus sp. B4113_201601]|nr:hypothetical protein B4113_1495 [Geobacillus sp. B4113_201601]